MAEQRLTTEQRLTKSGPVFALVVVEVGLFVLVGPEVALAVQHKQTFHRKYMYGMVNSHYL